MPALLIVDSIQTMFTDTTTSTPGSLVQVRECAGQLMVLAKTTGVPVLLVGHVNKEGMLAGPKVLEHLVDTVMNFEGDRHQHFRILRSTKNRFGATPALGVYEMRPDGLLPVLNPSALFIGERDEPQPGVAIAATLHAGRPLLIEVQALVTKAAYGTPQRVATGFDLRRMNMLVAVLEKKLGFRLGDQDIFLNLTGGLKLDDPGLDLPAAMAIVSALHDLPMPKGWAMAGEIGLTGELRSVSRLEQRASEVGKLGFDRFCMPGQSVNALTAVPQGLQISSFPRLEGLFQAAFRAGQ
jgi:DNA repair protein RadA/Sms